jgi:phosphoribosylamine--glycine ligase
LVFHAGTKIEGGQVVTNGGRVLAFSAFGPDKLSALSQSKKAAESIHFDKKYFRTDIGFDLD